MYKVNLLPEYLQPRRFSNRNITQLVGCVLFIFTLVLSSIFFYCQTRSLENQLANQINELDKLQPRLAQIQNLKTTVKNQQEQYLELSSLVSHRLVWHPFLEDLPLALPADTWLNGIEIKRPENIPQDGGFVSSGYKPQPKKVEDKQEKPEFKSPVNTAPPVPNVIYLYGSCWTMGSVGVLVDNLCLLPYFSSVQLVESNYDRRKGFIQFEIVAKIKGGVRDGREIQQPKP